MKKTDVTQPVAIATPFAEGVYSSTSTDDFEIPAATSTTADDSCVMDDGFLPITSTALDDGGKAPERKNFNGMFYLSTDQRFFLQNGGFITYNPDVATAIGGYPQDAILDFIDSNGNYKKVRSLIDDNTNNFVADETLIDGTNWEEISMGGSSRNIGEIVPSTIPLTDAGLHLLDGALIQYGSYQAFIDYIASIYDASASYFCTEAEWQQSVTNYGVCGKFVYDSVNNTVRLPKITGIIEGTTDVTALGDLVEAGLPNITGIFSTKWNEPASSGAFNSTAITDNRGTTTVSGNMHYENTFDASRSSSIYGNSSTVQPQTIKVLYYIVIATTTKTDIQVDIDEIATDLNGKADVDLTNVNNQGAALSTSWMTTDSSYEIRITPPASSSSGNTFANTTLFTAPCNGWVMAEAITNNSSGKFWIFGASSVIISSEFHGNGSSKTSGTFVKKGEQVILRGAYVSTIVEVIFRPCEGAKWEVQ